MSMIAYNLYVNITLGSFRFGGAADLERLMFVLFGFLQTALHPAFAYFQL